ncbi:uncharacterized protein LOC131220092 [Magnolia sinica]|uniref:uncharacterized protein LOC131220092 n=1 Tax=Magnolia sinica TaxID=86752 RepID=UPI00265A0A47|nr:uncharacterized protein LOC131220092 [Magnolia sinica]
MGWRGSRGGRASGAARARGSRQGNTQERGKEQHFPLLTRTGESYKCVQTYLTTEMPITDIMDFEVIISGSAGLLIFLTRSFPFNVFSQVSVANEGLDLFLEVETIIGGVTMVTMEAVSGRFPLFFSDNKLCQERLAESPLSKSLSSKRKTERNHILLLQFSLSKSPSFERKTNRNHVQLLQFDPLQCLETSILSSTPAICSSILGNIGEGRAFSSVSFCIRRQNISKKSSYSVGPTASMLSKSGCRHGYFHVVNNDYTHWEMYAIGGSANPTINSQGNRYLAPTNRFAKEALVVKLREGTGPNANTGVVTGVLATVGELARVHK